MKSALGREGHTPQYITKPALKKVSPPRLEEKAQPEIVESDSSFAQEAESTMQKLYNQAKELQDKMKDQMKKRKEEKDWKEQMQKQIK